MKISNSFGPVAALTSLALLTACGGGSTGSTTVATLAAAENAQAVKTVNANSNATTTYSLADSTKGAVTTDAASVLSTGMSYVSALTGGGGSGAVLVAVQTPSGSMPTTAGVVNYVGNGKAIVTTAGASYKVDMSSTLAADIVNGSATLTLVTVDAATATQQVGANPSAAYAVNGTENITVANLVITGAEISANAATTTINTTGFGSANVDSNDAAAGAVSAAGTFAGPAAEEVAGGVSKTDGTITVTFTGKK